jgi:hypothetical protein
MCRYHHIWILLIVCLSAIPLHAQPPDYNFRFTSRVIAADSAKTALRDCHVINKTLNLGTVSDQYGNFTITANRKDSIEFSILGYEHLVITVADSMFSNNRVIRLKPVAYLLSGVDVGRFSTYEQFKRDFMGMKVDSLPLTTIAPINRFEIAPKIILPGQGINLLPFYVSPITFLYNLLSNEGHQTRHYLSLINQTADYIRMGEKFNGEIVHHLTGLKNDELIDFMSQCHFSKDYLLYVSQEEINRDIMRKYKEYKIKTKRLP